MATSFESVVNTNTTYAYGTRNNTESERDYTKEWDWIIPTVICIIFIVFGLWILVSLVHYGIKTGKWNTHHRRSSEKLNIGEIYISVIITTAICICFLCVNLGSFNIGFSSGEDELCDTVSDIGSVIYALEIFSVCMFLWLRQRVFYKNFMFNADYRKIIRVFSSSSIVFVFLFGLAALVFSILPNNMKSSPNGCIYVPSDEYRVWYWVTTVVAVVFGQFTLVGLFIYGLKKTSKEQWISKQLCCYGSEENQPSLDLPSTVEIKSHSVSRSQSFQSFRLKSKPRTTSTSSVRSIYRTENQSVVVQKILWKTLIFAILSVLSDISLQVVVFFVVPSNSHRRIALTVGNFNAILNALFLVFSFVKWREIFTTFVNR